MGLLQSIAALFVAIDRRRVPASLTHNELGHYGEDVALAYLRRRGYRPVARNYDTPHGEIDLICRHGQTLVFIEVKTRRGTHYGRPGEAVGPGKQHRITNGALSYLQSLRNPRVACRFDVVEIEVVEGCVPNCRLIVDAFSAC
jgi:putative endonuclease